MSTFNQYQQILAKTPAAWRAVSGAVKTSVDHYETMAALMLAQNEHLVKLVHNQELFGRAANDAGRHMSALERTTQSVARHITDATRSILRWGTISSALAGLAGFGGLFGITRLAQGAAGDYRTATGLGVSPGQLRSMQAVFPYLANPESLLSAAAAGQFSAVSEEGRTQNILGISRQGDPFDIAMRTLEAAQRFAIQNRNNPNPNPAILEMFGRLGIDQATMRRLRDITPQQLREQEEEARRFSRRAEQDRATSDAWTKLMITLNEAAAVIEKSFIVGLKDLAQPISNLSKSFSHAVEVFLHSDTFRHWIDVVGQGLDWLSKNIDTPEFQGHIKSFIDGIGAMASAVEKIVSGIGKIVENPALAWLFGGATVGTVVGGPVGGVVGALGGAYMYSESEYRKKLGERMQRWLDPSDPEHDRPAAEVMQHFKENWDKAKAANAGPLGPRGDANLTRGLFGFATGQLGLDPAHAQAMLANALAESGLTAHGAPGAAGEMGMFQWKGDRWTVLQRELGEKQFDPYSQFAFAVREQMARDPGWFSRSGTAESLTREFESGFERPKTETGRLSELRQIVEMLRQGNTASIPPASVAPSSPQAVTPGNQQHSALPQVRIFVDNRTGGSAVITGSQLGAMA